jgi:hypothetical protein
VKDGEEVVKNAQEVAVFNGSVCLAAATVESDGFFYLTIPGDKTLKEKLSVYVVVDGEVIKTSTSLYFAEDATYGKSWGMNHFMSWTRKPLIIVAVQCNTQGQRFNEYTPVTYQNKEYPLRISRVVPEVKERMFTVELTFTDDMPDNARVGKSYRIQIELGKPEKSIVIPRGDFYSVTGGRWVYRLTPSGDKAVRVPITIGRQNPQQYEVLEGLQSGDRILISGYDKFGDAEQVEIN